MRSEHVFYLENLESNYEKAFIRVHHSKLMEILRQTQLGSKDIRIIGNLYWSQKAEVRTRFLKTSNEEIQRGFQQQGLQKLTNKGNLWYSVETDMRMPS